MKPSLTLIWLVALVIGIAFTLWVTTYRFLHQPETTTKPSNQRSE